MIDILYQDEFCIVVNKPNDMLVHHAKFSRHNATETSLLQALATQLGQAYYPVHRLDRRTSGLVLLTSQKEYVAAFQALFTSQQIVKVYFAVVRGFSPAELVIDSPVKGKDAKEHKDALTELHTLAQVTLPIAVPPYESSRYSMVALQPKTGRMHQLRIHMKKIAHPIIGDGKYGDYKHDAMYKAQWGFDTLFLHAGRLQFTHPYTAEELSITGPFPTQWMQLFELFSWTNPIAQ